MQCTCKCHGDPIAESNELGVIDRFLAPGVRLRINDVPTIVRTGGYLPGVRRYYSMDTAKKLDHLDELARLRMRQGETFIALNFDDDATLGRLALRERVCREREGARKRYGFRIRRVPRYGSSDYYYERLRPVDPIPGEG